MQLSLISQILAENDYVQQLPIGQEPTSIVSSHKRLKKLVNQLKHFSPTQKNYCVALTILSNCIEMDLEQMKQHYYRSAWDRLSKASYILVFERLQYQTNLAVSLLS